MQFANIQWNNQQPYSLDFDDVYYSSDDGLAETEYVFIEHNQLIERFKHLNHATFTIIETGFGTGLNFFCAVQHFLTHGPKTARLQFISIERYPLLLNDFIKANQHWPMFNTLVAELQTKYKQLTDGLNTCTLCNDRIQLCLWIGDVSECLPNVEANADAWFLDGFAPSKNNAMWSELLFADIAKRSKQGTTFATFTSAGQVRRRLTTAGFNVKKAAGFGKKREMLYGTNG